MSQIPPVPSVFDHLGDIPPVGKLLSWTLLGLNEEAQSIRLQFTSPPELANPLGTTHGGLVTTMLDECMASAIVGVSQGEHLPVTISMTTDFMRPVPTGEIVGHGAITSMSRSTAFVEATLTDADDVALARSVGTFRLLPFTPTLSA